MAASGVPWLGERLREQRLSRGISMRGLARDVGISASMISQIEAAKTQPSVSTLYAITSALGISIEDVFAPPAAAGPTSPDGPAPASPAGSGRAGGANGADGAGGAGGLAAGLAPGSPTTTLEGLDAIRGGRRRGPLVRPDERQVLALDSGVTWELLGELPPHPVDFLHVTYPPGSTSSSNGGLMRHTGAEFGFLLSGELTLTLGFDEIRVHPGDAISFDSTTPHAYRNDGTEPAVGVWFVIEENR